ncbi:MAG: PQQ-binding-like beta-propeller repeat protein [Chloroflexia bacterium]|nr:PQQ-binding-like beta-propeller repeat protein [Chloroflexia bacterium]
MYKNIGTKYSFIILCLLTFLLLSFGIYSCNSSASAREFEKVKNSASIEMLSQFIQEYPNADQTTEAEKIRNQLIFDSISDINKVETYEEFIQKHPDAEQIEAAKQKIEDLKGLSAVISTFRGNSERNYYGNKCPSKLDEIWTSNMGAGKSFAYGKMYVWTGAGWTGQPLIVTEDTKTYIIQGCFDYHLKKIDADNGKLIWKYKFDDIIKGTGTIYINKKAENKDEQVLIMQGSRRGEGISSKSGVVPSFRAVSYFSGKELWRMNSKKTPCYSRDVDASAAILGDTAYIGLENGIFTVFDPNPVNAEQRDGILQPKLYKETNLWTEDDLRAHGGNIVAESSPTIFNGKVYIVSGSGHVYGYNLETKKVDWDFT